MTLHPHHLNGYGTVQGGAIFTLADFVFAATPLKGEWHLNKKKVHFHLLVDHVRALAT